VSRSSVDALGPRPERASPGRRLGACIVFVSECSLVPCMTASQRAGRARHGLLRSTASLSSRCVAARLVRGSHHDLPSAVKAAPMSDRRKNRPRLPPRGFIWLFWHTHRGIYRVTGWPRRSVASEEQPVGHPATHRHRASHGEGAKRDPWVLRGWSEPGHAGDERLGRRRARVVAQPPSASRSESRSRRRAVHGHGTGRRGR